ncbi:hypothetical protein AB0I00_13205 [Streptomyces sp. NPDC050803]|uniref:hypothetical protein n=1 Tax=unclassified Streptomyces TaxID=2593676 RepID=UPI003425AE1E
MSQILNGRGVSAAFDADAVHLDRSDQRVDIPLAAVREVRAVEGRAVEIVLTDGVTHRVEGGNPTATAAFAAALTAALPEHRDPAGSALVASAGKPRERVWPLLALLAAVPLAYLGYAVWVATEHGARVLGVVLGLLPLGLGLAGLFTAVQDTFRRIVLRRRGITVLAHAIGTEGKKSVVYEYTDTDGLRHTYTCRRRMPRTQLAYDPHKPERAAHAMWLPFLLGKLVVLYVGTAFWLVIGGVMCFGVLW